MLAKTIQKASAANNANISNVSDVFSTDYWVGTGSGRTITNGFNMTSLNSGLTIVKSIDGTQNYTVRDSNRVYLGLNTNLVLNLPDAETTDNAFEYVDTGYSFGSNVSLNSLGFQYIGWSFLNSERFFNVINYVGNGSSQAISHSLNAEPGMIIIKSRDSSDDWITYHRESSETPQNTLLVINSSSPRSTSTNTWAATLPNTDNFFIGADNRVNKNGERYIAYVFAHTPFSSGNISCGSYVGNGFSPGPSVTIGWEPQWVLVRSSSNFGRWLVFDSVRDPANPREKPLSLGETAAQNNTGSRVIDYTSSGFQVKTIDTLLNASGTNYIYMAIRKEGV